MKNILSMVLFGLVIQGCASTGIQGNKSFISSVDVSKNLAQESADQVKNSLAVAKTTLVIDESTEYGSFLAEDLRVLGFGVTNEPAVNAVNLAYVVDSIVGENGVYRVLMEYDNRRFSRLYQLNDRSLNALGNWSVVTVHKPLSVNYKTKPGVPKSSSAERVLKEESIHVVIE